MIWSLIVAEQGLGQIWHLRWSGSVHFQYSFVRLLLMKSLSTIGLIEINLSSVVHKRRLGRWSPMDPALLPAF